MLRLDLLDRQQARLNRAINFAHNHCTTDLSLDELAKVACMSKYHFTRVFGDHVGESPIQFLSRIRLERIAYLLTYCRELPITEIAIGCGYSSNQTMSRSFGRQFGCSPREFRLNHVFRHGKSGSSKRLEKVFEGIRIGASDNNEIIPSFPTIKVLTLPSNKVAYVRNLGEYGSGGNISETIYVIWSWAKDHRLWNSNSVLIGASWDSAKVTPKRFCRYDACIQVPENFSPPDNVSCQIIPGGTYAVTRVLPQCHEIPLIWECFILALKEWPEYKNYRLTFGPWYESFRPEKLSGKTALNMYAPISANCRWHNIV